ncbi:MAG: succinate--CoA ligase subunit alpha [Pseudorhodoplanes sp.]
MLLGLDAQTPVLVQGISGRMGQTHAKLMRLYGTRIVGGTSARPQENQLFPVFPDCRSAVDRTGAQVSLIMVPPAQTLAAVADAIAGGLQAVVTVAEGVPVHDALQIRAMTREAGVTWLGPSTPGFCIPGQIKVGFLPDVSLSPGRIGFMSKSGTLSYEVGYRLVSRGHGQSAWIGVGGDPVKGVTFSDLAEGFARHAATAAVVLVGEIGGSEEEDFADAWRQLGCGKPVFALIAGAQAKEGVIMGHAGALLMGERGSVASKTRSLRDAGVQVFSSIQSLVDAVDAQLLRS